VVVPARDPGRYLAHLRHLQRAGCPVVVLACGANAGADAAAARAAGLTARVGRLDGPWQTAAHLDLPAARRTVARATAPP
jgi:hypothetical protein